MIASWSAASSQARSVLLLGAAAGRLLPAGPLLVPLPAAAPVPELQPVQRDRDRLRSVRLVLAARHRPGEVAHAVGDGRTRVTRGPSTSTSTCTNRGRSSCC